MKQISLALLLLFSHAEMTSAAVPPLSKNKLVHTPIHPAKSIASRTTTKLLAVNTDKTTPAKIEFLRDVAPILDRSGCSVAECHGKFGGRGGLQLSLLTLSPEDDYDPLIHGDRGRRVNFAAPEKSLFLLKSTAQIAHKGGRRFIVGSLAYNTLLNWVKSGAPFEPNDPRLVTLTLQPPLVALKKIGQKQQLHTLAVYTDGSKRDVTAQTVFMSTNGSILQVSPAGMVTGGRWGGGAILGRYLGTIAASFFTLPQTLKGAYPPLPSGNLIDKMVFDNLKKLNVIPSAPSSDTEFLRRVTLDTLGRLPTLEEIAAYSKNTDPNKRAKKIDSLLDTSEFTDFRALHLADLLRVNPQKLGNAGTLGERGAELFYEWIWKGVASNKPWDQFVREIISARGSTYHNGPANFYRIENGANDRMENIGQAFLGVRMSCARCHKHPFDRWTTDDYWNFSAFTAKVGIMGGRIYNENVVTYSPQTGLANQSVNGRNKGKLAPATFLGEKSPAPDSPDQLNALAAWMTDSKNTFFSRAAVNRIWSYYFGKGIINPVDDMRATSPESVPGLLDALAQEFVKSKYDVKSLIREIMNSRIYQLSSIPNDSNVKDDQFFSRFTPRPMPAQALLDMLNQATGIEERIGYYPERSRAVQAASPVSSYFLDSFGQSHREFLADIDPKLEPNLVQTLHMINSPYIESKVRDGHNTTELLKHTKSPEDVVRNLYLRTFSREPSTAEVSKSAAVMAGAKDLNEGAQDLLWALVTSREFYFNH